MRRGHIPERTCRGCGRKGPSSTLIRWVVVAGKLVEDGRKQLPGKGIYCCIQGTCCDRMAKKVKKILGLN